MRLEVLGAILAMIAPFVFHFLLQTGLRMRDIILIMIGIALLSIMPAMDFPLLNQWLGQISPNLIIKSTLILAIVILALWQLNHRRKRSKKRQGD